MTVDDAVQQLAARLGHPVVLYDADLHLVAFSTHDEDEADEVRRSIILNRRASARAVEMIRRSGVNQARDAVRIPQDAQTGSMARFVFPVRRRERIVGYVSYLDDRDDIEPLPRQLGVLHASSDELGGLLYARQLEREQNRDRLTTLLGQLVFDDAGARASAAGVLLDEGFIGVSTQYTAVVLRSPASRQAASSSPDRLAVEDCLAAVRSSSLVKVVGALVGNDALLVLPEPPKRAALDRLVTKAGHGRVYAGIGDPRAELTEMASSYREATVAVRAPMADASAYGVSAEWGSLGVDRLLLQLPLAEVTTEDLPPGIQRLLTASSGPDLAATLETYLDTGGDAQATARLLLIHRSTLYYRLDRIRQITGADLADGRVRMELHTGLRAASLAGLR